MKSNLLLEPGESGGDSDGQSHAAARVGRLAPAPTGALHLGNARTFLVAWLSVRSLGGRLILRIEDLDHPKTKAGASEELIQDLAWLGLDWDEGPDRGGPAAPYVQSARRSIYKNALESLQREGLVYPCACSRKDVQDAQSAPHAGEELRYPGTCRGRFSSYAEALEAAGGRPCSWRFFVDAQPRWPFVDALGGPQDHDLREFSGDFVIARGVDEVGYQLAVVVDDAAMGVSQVVRGNDLLLSTHRQLALFSALKLVAPKYCHLPLILGRDGRRLAKRHGDTRLSALRAAGVKAQQVIQWLARSLGYSDPPELEARELISDWSLADMPRGPVIVAESSGKAILPDFEWGPVPSEGA